MKTLKTLLLAVCFFLLNQILCNASTHCGGAEFKTGEDYWEQSKIQYRLQIAEQCRHRHASKVDALNFLPDFESSLRCPLDFTVDVQKGIDLKFILRQGGFTQFQLYLAFNEAIVEIFDTSSQLFAKAKYVRSDLNKIKDYFAEAVTFLKGVQEISKYVFKGEKSDFKEGEFLKSLDHFCYKEAKLVNSQTREWEECMKTVYGGKITIEQYLEYYTTLYSELFTNQYIFLKAHLISQDRMTRLKLNRKLEGGLKSFTYNLTTVNLLDSLNRKPSTKTETIPAKKKAKKTKKRRNKKATKALPSPTLAQEETKGPSEPISTPENIDINPEPAPIQEEQPALRSSLPSQPLLNETELSFQKNEDPPQEEGQIIALEQEEEKTQVPVNLSHHLDLGNSTSSKPTIKEKEAPHSFGHKKQISKLKQLNHLLEDFDGGPTAGMKTRKFLRLCAALNEQGYFSEFSATQKEVFIKTDKLVTVMHTNHSGRKKSPGISGNTAKKLQEVIESIQQ